MVPGGAHAQAWLINTAFPVLQFARVRSRPGVWVQTFKSAFFFLNYMTPRLAGRHLSSQGHHATEAPPDEVNTKEDKGTSGESLAFGCPHLGP